MRMNVFPHRANGNASTAKPPSVLQRMHTQVTSFTATNTRKTSQREARDSLRDECRDGDDVVLRHGNSDPDASNPEDGDEQVKQPRCFISWVDAKKRVRHTTSVMRDACMSKSRMLFASAAACTTYSRRTPAAEKDERTACKALDTPQSETREQRRSDASRVRGSEISIRMSSYSSRSTGSDQDDMKRHGSGICMRKKSASNASSAESDLFRRRCSSVDSYRSELRDPERNEELDDTIELDHDEETIRESLFLKDGEMYRIKSEWV